MSRPAIGKSNLSGERVRKKYFSCKDGNNVYRILPAMFDLASKGQWSMFYRVEFGYKNSDNRMKPFLSPRRVNKDKMVEVESAAHLHRVALKQELDDLKASLKGQLEAGTITKDEAKTALEEQKKLVKQYNLDSKHYMNVINEAGEIGLLKIPNRAMQALRPLLKELEQKNIDPLSVDNGRWFNFNRSGMGLDTVYTVSVVKEQVEVEGHGTLEKDKIHVLSDSVLDRLEKEAFKLDQIFPAPTAEEVDRIVNEGPKAVDEIFAQKQEEPKTEAPAAKPETAPAPVQEAAPVAKEEPAPVAKEEVKEPVIETKKPDLQALKEAAGVAPAPKKEAPAAPAPAASTEEDDDAWMDEFQ